jgi:hypothetical protein
MSRSGAETAAAARKRQQLLEQKEAFRTKEQELQTRRESLLNLAAKWGYGGMSLSQGTPASILGPGVKQVREEEEELEKEKRKAEWKSLSELEKQNAIFKGKVQPDILSAKWLAIYKEWQERTK